MPEWVLEINQRGITMEKEQNNSFFHCYSFNLYHFLKSQGFNYINKCKNRTNNLTYLTFEKSNALNSAIRKWNELKEKSKMEEL